MLTGHAVHGPRALKNPLVRVVLIGIIAIILLVLIVFVTVIGLRSAYNHPIDVAIYTIAVNPNRQCARWDDRQDDHSDRENLGRLSLDRQFG